MKRTNRLSIVVLSVVPFLGFVTGAAAQSCSSGHSSSTAADKDIVDTAVAGKFDTLVAAVKAAGMVDALKGDGPLTVFAPTDEAFAKLSKGTLDALLKAPAKLRTILKYHVVSGRVMAADVAKLTSAKSLLGQTLKIDAGKQIRINNATVTAADVACKNGVIHVIDAVLLPQDDIIDVAAKVGSFKTLLKAVEAAGLTDTLRSEGPLTVFAPTDEAFGKLPKETLDQLLRDPAELKKILTYHVVAGKVPAAEVVKLNQVRTVEGGMLRITAGAAVRVNDAQVVKTDVHASNGLIHVIDTLELPGSH